MASAECATPYPLLGCHASVSYSLRVQSARSNSDADCLRTLLREARERAGLRQVDVAARLSVPQSFVSKYESGERSLDFVEVFRICRVLGLPFSQLARTFESCLDDS